MKYDKQRSVVFSAQDSAVTAAILDRLIHHSRVFQITGNSYRMKDYKLEREQRSKKKTPDDPH
jgi:DNA replication protein DnaC